MLSDLIVAYLFLGGLGAGTCGAWCITDEIFCRRGSVWERSVRRVAPTALAISLGALVVGSLCLLADLAADDRAYLLFTRPTFSAITVGSFCLVGLMAVVVVLLRRELGTAGQGRCLSAQSAGWKAGKLVALGLSVAVAAYTGFLLASMASVPFWCTPLLPVLFTLSSASCGFAVMALVSTAVFWDAPHLAASLAFALRLDAAIIVLEIIACAGAALTAGTSAAVLAAFERLLVGEMAIPFWAGFVGLGLVVPLASELLFALRPPKNLAPYVIIGCCVLIGALFLRVCIVESGVHLSTMLFGG